MPDIMKIGIIGAGTIANAHAKALAQLADRAVIGAVCDLDVNVAKQLAPSPDIPVFSDYREMLKMPKIDICLVCLPHSLHHEVGIEILKADKHLFLEKPMALNVAECRELIAAEQNSGKTIFTGHTHQYRNVLRKAREMIIEGVIGNPAMIVSEIIAYYNWEKRKPWFLDPKISGGGPLFNTSPHQADHLLFLIDSPITAVRAQVANLRSDAAIDSDVAAFVEYENGVRGMLLTFSGTKLEDPARLKCRVMGDTGSIQFNPFGDEIELLKGDGKKIISLDNADAFVLEWREMLESIAQDREPQTGSRYGHNAVALLEAILESSRSGKEIVPEMLRS